VVLPSYLGTGLQGIAGRIEVRREARSVRDGLDLADTTQMRETSKIMDASDPSAEQIRREARVVGLRETPMFSILPEQMREPCHEAERTSDRGRPSAPSLGCDGDRGHRR
jgi:hypothetical protein